MLPYTDICANLQYFIDYCTQRSVQLVLATKTIDKATLEEVAEDYPNLVFGENRQQELCEKYFPKAHWIFIGRLQRNKVKYLADKVDMICSVDTASLAAEIEKQCAAIGKIMPVLVEVNLGEEQKGGVPEQEIEALFQVILSYPHLSLQGLMAVLPKENPQEAAALLQTIYRRYALQYGFKVLSVGMSQDYQLGVEYGSNMIRIGSAVFGQRS